MTDTGLSREVTFVGICACYITFVTMKEPFGNDMDQVHQAASDSTISVTKSHNQAED